MITSAAGVIAGSPSRVAISLKTRNHRNGRHRWTTNDIHDIDARFRALPKGDHVAVEPEPTHWGTRWFVVRDPDGNVIAFEELHGRGG